jgi:hypothetical protein
MNARRLALSALFVAMLSAVAITGCASGSDEPEVGSGAQAQVHGNYGYVMIDEKVTAAVTVPARPAEVQGRLAPELIRDTVRAGFEDLRACDTAARGANDAAPAMTVRFVIDAAGAVHGARTEDVHAADATMQSCVRDAITDMHFPKSTEGNLEVAYPLMF